MAKGQTLTVRLIIVRRAYKHFLGQNMPDTMTYRNALRAVVKVVGVPKMAAYNSIMEAEFKEPAGLHLWQK